ncbi:hypothetical protein B1810_06010 [Panacagrimonas perspica]|nr:hypothetical protein B1810_06010 [Panacagrimonas perspica]
MGDPTHYRSQFGSRDGGRASSWDPDSAQGRQMGAGDDRFGGYTGNYGHGESYDPQHHGGHPVAWDEEGLAYPEPGRHRHDVQGGRAGSAESAGADWSRGPDRYYWHNRYGGSSQFGPNGPSNFAPRTLAHRRGFEPERSGDPRYGRSGQPDWSGESFAGGRDAWSGNNRSYGIPSGNDPGGYRFNSTWDGDGTHHWSGSNWANDQDWQQGPRRTSAPGARQGGRTPKGYTRSDERIRDDVCETLYRAHDIDVSDVSVESKNGTITLEGTVSDRRMKHRIEDLCEHCIGVNDVDNRIRVVRETSSGFSADRTRDEGNADERASNRVLTSSKKGTTPGSTPH